MSQIVKVNMAVLGAAFAMVVSVGGVLIGAGTVLANQQTNRNDINQNAEKIENVRSAIGVELHRMREQMRSDKTEVLEAIRSIDKK